ncbi:MAG: hypothetical protein RB292_00330 [Patescibacteria group bacterium]|jgi:hypothetical protein|nr:hypothetical protein [Patescibacteria group bacterium]
MNCQKPKSNGYIALVALLIVAAVGLSIGLAVSLGGIDEIQVSYGTSQAVKAKAMANACIEEGLGRLRNNWANYSGSLSIADNSCIIMVMVDGNMALLTATGTVDIYVQKLQVEVDDSLNIIDWQEN